MGFILGKKTSMIGEKNKFGLKFRFRLYNLHSQLSNSGKIVQWLTAATLFIFCFSPTRRSHTHTHTPTSVGHNFPSKCFGCIATTNVARWKWILWLDSAPQIGLEPTPKGFLIVVGNLVTGESKSLSSMTIFSPEFSVFWL